MADFTQIIQEINDDINTNGVGAITGAKLNEVLRDMIAAVNAAKTDILPDGALYGGFAYPNEPPTYGDDHRYFYIARQQGNYPAFDVELDGNSLVLFYWFEQGQAWYMNYLAVTPVGLQDALQGYLESKYLYISLGFDSFSPHASYVIGDYVSNLDNEGILYKFTSNHPAGQWDDNDVVEVTLLDYITDYVSKQLSGKQDTISDLATIRSGAAAGATAVQPSDLATVATSGSYNDLLNKPTIPAAQVQSDWNEADNTKVDYIKNKPTIPNVSGKADKVVGATSGDVATLDSTGNLTDSGLSVFDFFVMVEDATTPPASMLPNNVYKYGTLSGNTTFPPLATPTEPDIANVYCWTFTTPATAPTITWPSAITSWAGGSAPTINASKSYEVSVMDGFATIIEN